MTRVDNAEVDPRIALSSSLLPLAALPVTTGEAERLRRRLASTPRGEGGSMMTAIVARSCENGLEPDVVECADEPQIHQRHPLHDRRSSSAGLVDAVGGVVSNVWSSIESLLTTV